MGEETYTSCSGEEDSGPYEHTRSVVQISLHTRATRSSKESATGFALAFDCALNKI